MSLQLRKPNWPRSLTLSLWDTSSHPPGRGTCLLLSKSLHPTSRLWSQLSQSHSHSWTSVCWLLWPRPPHPSPPSCPVSAPPAETPAWPGTAPRWLSPTRLQRDSPTAQQKPSQLPSALQWMSHPKLRCRCPRLPPLQWPPSNQGKQGA